VVSADERVHVRLFWINPNHRFATAFATDLHVQASVTLRLRFGQHHKSLFDKNKPFIHKHLQNLDLNYLLEGLFLQTQLEKAYLASIYYSNQWDKYWKSRHKAA